MAPSFRSNATVRLILLLSVGLNAYLLWTSRRVSTAIGGEDAASRAHDGPSQHQQQLGRHDAVLAKQAMAATVLTVAGAAGSSTQAKTVDVTTRASISAQTTSATIAETAAAAVAKTMTTSAATSNTTVSTPTTSTTTTTTTTPPPPIDHPHAGARGPDGAWGYVADVYRVRNHFLQAYANRSGTNSSSGLPPMTYMPFQSEKEMNDICNPQDPLSESERQGVALISKRVIVNAPTPVNPNNNATTNSSSTSVPRRSNNVTTPPRILCFMYTYEGGHHRLPAIRDTWGWRCDGFFAASTVTIEDPNDDGFGAIDLPHLGKEEYGNMWQKVRSMWSYVYDNYRNDFDYFYVCGDDTHLIFENLRNYLATIHQNRKANSSNDDNSDGNDDPLYLGQWLPLMSPDQYFIGGGPGYVLNRKALSIMVKDIYPWFLRAARSSAEDRFTGNALRQRNILGNASVDDFGRQRFFSSDPKFVASYDGKQGRTKGLYEFWGRHFGFKAQEELVSPQSVAFHLLRYPVLMKRHHAILYRSCPVGTKLGDEHGTVLPIDKLAGS